MVTEITVEKRIKCADFLDQLPADQECITREKGLGNIEIAKKGGNISAFLEHIPKVFNGIDWLQIVTFESIVNEI